MFRLISILFLIFILFNVAFAQELISFQEFLNWLKQLLENLRMVGVLFGMIMIVAGGIIGGLAKMFGFEPEKQAMVGMIARSLIIGGGFVAIASAIGPEIIKVILKLLTGYEVT